jgi:hypothetical protein
MQTKTKLEAEDIEVIKTLADKYNITLEGSPPYSSNTVQMMSKYGNTPTDIHIKRLNIFFIKNFDFAKITTHDFIRENLEVAQLIKFLYEVIQNQSEVTFSSTIKGIKKSVSLSSFSSLRVEYWLLANTYLDYIQDGLYQYEFQIPFFEFPYYSFGENKENSGVFADEDLNKIIEYERKNYNEAVVNSKKRLAIKLKALIRLYRADNVFDQTMKTIATKEACFLFDTLAYLGIIPETRTENNSEKYEFIKKELRK